MSTLDRIWGKIDNTVNTNSFLEPKEKSAFFGSNFLEVGEQKYII